jgi:electron transport complex protein RnfG
LGKTAVIYYTEDEALKKMMPDADRFETKEVALTTDQQLQAEQITGKKLSDAHVRYIIATKGQDIIGYGFPMEVIGKERPITLLIGITNEGAIIAVEVLIYRESQGSEIRYPRFMAQFKGKKKDDPLGMGSDIQSISGATLSSRGTAYGVKKALALFSVVSGRE